MSFPHIPNRHRLLLSLPLLLALVAGSLIGSNAGSLGGWGTLFILVGAAAVVALLYLSLSLREWRKPFLARDLHPLLWGVSFESPDQRVSPLEVETALRGRLSEWAEALSDAEEATVLFHRSSHADYDIRIVNEDGQEADRWVCLIQAKARPVHSTLQHLAKAKEREDAQEAVLLTVPICWQELDASGLLKAAEKLKVQIAPFEALDQIPHGRHPTIEVYVEAAPPGAEARVFAQR